MSSALSPNRSLSVSSSVACFASARTFSALLCAFSTFVSILADCFAALPPLLTGAATAGESGRDAGVEDVGTAVFAVAAAAEAPSVVGAAAFAGVASSALMAWTAGAVAGAEASGFEGAAGFSSAAVGAALTDEALLPPMDMLTGLRSPAAPPPPPMDMLTGLRSAAGAGEDD